MRFLRSVKGYTRLDKIRSEVIRKGLEISGIQDVRSNHKQNWINHLERTDNTRLPKHALNYKPRGRRDRGRPRKRWQHLDAGISQSTNPWRMMMMMMMMMMM
jgi:predicted ArsR family transcriptional regulator